MKARRLICLLLCPLLLSSLAGCLRQKNLSNLLGVDLSAGQLLRETDSHGGFLGDGSQLLILAFSETDGAALSQSLSQAPGWKPLPPPESIAQALWGDECHSSLILSAEKIPAVTEGFYWFYDRHSQSQDPGDPGQLWDRPSFNFSLALYDSQSCRLYYYELDT